MTKEKPKDIIKEIKISNDIVLKSEIGTELTIDMSRTNSEDWLVIVDEKYRPDKNKFVIEQFNKDYPNIKVDSATSVYNLASRSSHLNEWLGLVNLEYAKTEQVPQFYRELVKAEDFIKSTEILTELRKLNVSRANRESALAIQYNSELAKVRREINEAQKKISGDNKLVKILNLNSQSLPLTIQLAIVNYTPADKDSPNAEAYSREMLVRYKSALIKAMNENPEIDIDELVKSLSTK